MRCPKPVQQQQDQHEANELRNHGQHFPCFPRSDPPLEVQVAQLTPAQLANLPGGIPSLRVDGARALLDAGERAVDLAVIARVRNARELTM